MMAPEWDRRGCTKPNPAAKRLKRKEIVFLASSGDVSVGTYLLLTRQNRQMLSSNIDTMLRPVVSGQQSGGNVSNP